MQIKGNRRLLRPGIPGTEVRVFGIGIGDSRMQFAAVRCGTEQGRNLPGGFQVSRMGCLTKSTLQRDAGMICRRISPSFSGLHLAGALLLAGAGCTSTSTDSGEPLSITLTVDRTAGSAAVDTFTFQYSATGSELLGIVLDFGDGQVDSVAALGASRAGATRPHVYQTAGTFEAFARALEAFGSVLADTVVVEVQ
jgi:hypothetical protein